MRVTRARLVALAVAPVAAAATVLPQTAADAIPAGSVLVSEVYGGGGNSGATLTHDFIELANRGGSAVDVTGWSVRYYSAAGSLGGSTTLSGSVAAGGRYLVQEAKGAGGSAALPTPDATGSVAMSATSGRVDLYAADGTLVDRVGFGSSATSETAPAPTLSNTESATRRSICTDTDDNAADFAASTPTPASSAAALEPCAGTAPPPPSGDPAPTIAQIQGAAHVSPLAGRPVHGVSGVVVAVGPSGYWLQSTTPDADPATSEGIYVYTRSAPAVQAGDRVTVGGTVTEFRPGGSAGNDNLSTTEITAPTTTLVARAQALPAPVVIGLDRVAPQQVVEAGDPKDVESPDAPFRPATDAIDFYESLEGMRVAVRDAQVVGPTTSFGEIAVVPGRRVAALRSSAGGVVYGGYDQPNAMRVQLDDALVGRSAMPRADVGDRLPGDTVGVLDYSFANVKLLVTAAPQLRPGGLVREVTAAQRDSQLAVATFNVENLDPSDPQSKFDRLARQIVSNLRSPDLLALEEIQDGSGPARDGVVDSAATSDRLIAAVAAAGGPRYEARWVDPTDGADGGQPGGNIRQVFLFRTDRGLRFVDRPGGDATTPVDVAGQGRSTHLTLSPGRVNPASSAWASSRKPLAGEFRFRGQIVFVVANHFASKGGDDPLFGRWQQPVRGSEVQRAEQARQVRSFVDKLLAADGRANVVVLGDINDFEFSRTTDILVGDGSLVDLPRTLPASERWTYVYQGNSQVLDQILISRALAGAPRGGKRPAYDYDIVHTNSPFADQDSDHDPQVVRLTLRGGRS